MSHPYQINTLKTHLKHKGINPKWNVPDTRKNKHTNNKREQAAIYMSTARHHPYTHTDITWTGRYPEHPKPPSNQQTKEQRTAISTPNQQNKISTDNMYKEVHTHNNTTTIYDLLGLYTSKECKRRLIHNGHNEYEITTDTIYKIRKLHWQALLDSFTHYQKAWSP